MTDALTSWFIVANAILIIAFDVWTVWKKGGNATISWTMCLWWVMHPMAMVGVFALVGHMFWPLCAPAGATSTQSVSASAGTTVAVVASSVICKFVSHVLHEPNQWTGNGPTVSRAYLFRLGAFALVGLYAGHRLFGQYILCAS